MSQAMDSMRRYCKDRLLIAELRMKSEVELIALGGSTADSLVYAAAASERDTWAEALRALASCEKHDSTKASASYEQTQPLKKWVGPPKAAKSIRKVRVGPF